MDWRLFPPTLLGPFLLILSNGKWRRRLFRFSVARRCGVFVQVADDRDTHVPQTGKMRRWRWMTTSALHQGKYG